MKFNSLNEVFNFDEEDTFNGLQHVNKFGKSNKTQQRSQKWAKFSKKQANLTKIPDYKYSTRVPCAALHQNIIVFFS